MKKLLLALALLLTFSALGIFDKVRSQINVVPQVGLNTANLRQNTYGAVSVGLVPAASATDIFCISGSATKTVTIHNIVIGGTAGTAITTPVDVLRRVSLDTGGTLATGIALPVAGRLDSATAAATAILTAYTANPTINDGSPTLISTAVVPFLVTTAGSSGSEITFGTTNDAYDQGLILRGVSQQMCLNLNSASISSGVIAISIEWTEQ